MQRLFHSTSFIFVFAKIKRLKIYTKSENPQCYYSFPKLHFHIISKRVAKSSERKNVAFCASQLAGSGYNANCYHL